MQQQDNIVLAGDGWGAVAAFNGIKKAFNYIDVVTNDKHIINLDIAEQINDINLLENRLIVCAGYKPLIKKNLLEKNIFINVHYSLLPKYRGLHSTVWAILNNEKYLGFTIHLINEYIDDGDIIYQYKVENDFSKTAPQYMEDFNQVVSDKLGLVLKKFLDRKIIPIKQDKENATWVGRRKLDDCKIDFFQSSHFLKAFFRALSYPYPLPFFIHKKQRIQILQHRFHKANCKTHIGRVLNIDEEGIWIKIKEGYLIVSEMRDENQNNYSPSMFRIGQFLNKI